MACNCSYEEECSESKSTTETENAQHITLRQSDDGVIVQQTDVAKDYDERDIKKTILTKGDKGVSEQQAHEECDEEGNVQDTTETGGNGLGEEQMTIVGGDENDNMETTTITDDRNYICEKRTTTTEGDDKENINQGNVEENVDEVDEQQTAVPEGDEEVNVHQTFVAEDDDGFQEKQTTVVEDDDEGNVQEMNGPESAGELGKQQTTVTRGNEGNIQHVVVAEDDEEWNIRKMNDAKSDDEENGLQTSVSAVKLENLQEVYSDIETKALTEDLINAEGPLLQEDQKRWLIVGICLHCIVSPACRKSIPPTLRSLYDALKRSDNIEGQTFANYLRRYKPTNKDLNYEAINNNAALPKIRGKLDLRNYDFRVQNETDLSKLFLPTSMTHYTAFDDSCDFSAILGIVINVDLFEQSLRLSAETVRDDVRNQWAHCNFSAWDMKKFQESSMLMKQVITCLQLPGQDETDLLDQLNSWKTNGLHLLQGMIGFQLLKDLKKEIMSLTSCHQRTCGSSDRNFTEVLRAFQTVERRVCILEEHLKPVRTTIKNDGQYFSTPDKIAIFVGREKELQELEQKFKEKENRTFTQAICGLGGIGKTTLAVEFSWRYRDFYPGGVFWVLAENDETLLDSIQRLAIHVGIEAEETRNRLRKVMSWLASKPNRWLLVVDNVDVVKVTETVAEFLSRDWKRDTVAHTIITTRRERENTIENFKCDFCINLHGLSILEGIEFMKKRTSYKEDEGKEDDDEALKHIVQNFGGLPLALEQAAGQIKIVKPTFSEYLETFEVEPLKCLRTIERSDHFHSVEDRLAVQTTWNMNFDFVKNESEKLGLGTGPITVMDIFALLPSTEIILKILNTGSPPITELQEINTKGVPNVNDIIGDLHRVLKSEFSKKQAIEILGRFSIVDREQTGRVHIHQLVKQKIIASMSIRRKFLITDCIRRMARYLSDNELDKDDSTEPTENTDESARTDIYNLESASASSPGSVIKKRRGEDSGEYRVIQLQVFKGSMVTAAIDIGSASTGIAFSFRNDPFRIYTYPYWNKRRMLSNALKEPTKLLLRPDRQFEAFGYDAESKYADLLENGDHQGWYYFENIKFQLYHQEKLSRESVLTDMQGKEVSAMKIFSMVIWNMRNQLKTSFEENKICITEDEAGIPEKQLKLILETEASSVFFQALSVLHNPTMRSTYSHCKVEQMYILADLGSFSSSIVVDEVLLSGSLRELYRASWDGVGGTRVNWAFLTFMEDLFGQEVFNEFRQSSADDYSELLTEFELKKQKWKRVESYQMDLRVPAYLNACLFDRRGLTLDQCIKEHRLSSVIYQKRDKMVLSSKLIDVFFSQSVDGVLRMLRESVLGANLEGENLSLLLTGGFSDSPYVYESIKTELVKEFDKLQVLKPEEASLHVSKGAVLITTLPTYISERVSRYSYGLRASVPFDKNVHRLEYIDISPSGDVSCSDIFYKFIGVGQILKLGNVEKIQFQGKSNSSEARSLEVYRSTHPDPKYCTKEHGCELAGQVILQPPEEGWADRERFTAEIEIGETVFKISIIYGTNPVEMTVDSMTVLKYSV